MTMPRRLRAAAALIAPIALAGAAVSAPAVATAQAKPTPPAGCTGKPSDTWITIVAEGMRNGNGLLAVTVYADNSSKFLVKNGSLYVGRNDAQAGTTRQCVFVPKPGVYAFALYHDENSNMKIDRTGMGLPAEGFGFSNNPATLAGLPTFKSVRLNVPKTGLTTRVQMKYP